MKTIVRKILGSGNKGWQIWLSGLGAVAGLFVFMAGLSLWLDVAKMMSHEDLLSEDYLVISKKVGILNTISGGPAVFTKDELAEIRALKPVSAVGEFTGSRFKSVLELAPEMAGFGGQMLKTDLFFESVPDEFMDAGKSEWNWKPGDPEVPVVIPTDIIRQYNHGFASSQGLPVIPENLLTNIRFKLKIKGNGSEESFSGFIAGFSDRISTILVPQTFMNYANQRHGNWEHRGSSRLILKCSNTADPVLLQFLEKEHYEVNREKLKSGKTNLLMHLLLSLVAGVGLLIVLLALLGYIQYYQLLAYRSAYEIQTLHWLGYSLAALNKPYISAARRQILFTLIIAVPLFLLSQWYLQRLFLALGFNPSFSGWIISLPSAVLLSGLMYAISVMMIKKQVAQLAL